MLLLLLVLLSLVESINDDWLFLAVIGEPAYHPEHWDAWR